MAEPGKIPPIINPDPRPSVKPPNNKWMSLIAVLIGLGALLYALITIVFGSNI